MIKKLCEICNNEFKIFHSRIKTAKYCSASCRGFGSGVKRLLKVKKRISTQGYYYIKKPNHYRCNKQGYVKIADIILEEKINRKLNKNEIAHHINGDRLDDSPQNLEVMKKGEHDSLTGKERWSKWRLLSKWSIKHDCCIVCSTTSKKHARLGLCTTCSHLLERGKITREYINKLV